MEGREKTFRPLLKPRSTTGPHGMILILFLFLSFPRRSSGSARLTNCALCDKSTKFGIDVH